MNRPSITPIVKLHAFINHRLRNWLGRPKADIFSLTISLAGFTMACFLASLIIGHQHQQQMILIDTYGNALSQLATNQLKVSMSNHNLIGLQSILNDLIKQTKVINAIIYGIDNKIIVQAVDIDSINTTSLQVFTSPITLDDALLGSLNISIDNSTTNNDGLILALLMLMAGLLLLLRALSNQALKEKSEQQKNSGSIHHDQRKISFSAIKIQPPHQALLILHFHTLDKLYQQLNADARHREFKRLELVNKKILTLYSGQQIAATPNSLTINFEGKDKKECLINALCCAYLLEKTNKKQRWLIHFSSLIYDKESSISINHLAQLKSLDRLHSNSSIIIQEALAIKNQLNEQLILERLPESDYFYVTGFSDTYEKLLKKQLSHIL